MLRQHWLNLPLLITHRLSDLVGADVGLHVGQNFLDAFPERTYPAGLIKKLNEAKRLGEKTGAGFYAFDAKRKARPDPALAPIVEASRKVRARMRLGRHAEIGMHWLLRFRRQAQGPPRPGARAPRGGLPQGVCA